MIHEKKTHAIRIAGFVLGMILLLLALYHMPESPTYSAQEVNITFYIAIITLTAVIVTTIINPSGESQQMDDIYQILEDNKILPIKNSTLIVLIFILSIMGAALYVREPGDFGRFMLVFCIGIFLLLTIQYHRAFHKIFANY